MLVSVRIQVWGADSLVRGGQYANTNYGDGEVLIAKDTVINSDAHRKSWIKFDLSTISENISEVELELTIAGFGGSWPNPDKDHSFTIWGLNDGQDAWSENQITWNNAPENNTTGRGISAGVELGDITVSKDSAALGDKVRLNSEKITAFLSTDTDHVVTLVLLDATPAISGVTFATKENGVYDAPTLNVTTVPVPAAIWLFATALLGIRGLKKD